MIASLHSLPRLWVITLSLLAFTIAASAAPPAGAPELERLRASYKAAVAKGTKSILQAHISVLEKLRDIYTRGSQLPEANKVQADIDRANVAMSTGEFLSPSADANNAAAPELHKLRAGHDANIERALKPYQETYVRELEKLRDNYTRSANLAAAVAVQAEIDEMRPAGTLGKPAAVGDDKFFVNKSWYSLANVEYHFDKDGSGVRIYTNLRLPFTWRKLDTGIIEITGRIATGGPQVMWFCKFDNKKTAVFGKTMDSIVDPLRADK